MKFAADLTAAQEAKAIEIAESLKTKVPKAKVPFYYDKKAFAVSASPGFIKRLEKENWKDFMSFVKENAAPAELMVEGSAALVGNFLESTLLRWRNRTFLHHHPCANDE